MDVTFSGIPGLDVLLGGGLPTGNLIVVVGPPGTGKTLFLQQLCCAWVRNRKLSPNPNSEENNSPVAVELPVATPRPVQLFSKKPAGAKALYFSTLSEPHNKLLQHIRQFDFFDEKMLPADIKFLSLTRAMEQGLEAVADLILETARSERTELITIDGLGALEDLEQGRVAIRRFLYRLSAQLNVLNVTTVVTLERSLERENSEGELTLADGIISLTYHRLGARRLRRVEVVKLRGMKVVEGLHTYEISNSGITFYPRLESLTENNLDFAGSGKTDLRLDFGLSELDRMFNNGLPLASSTVIAGSIGVGKTLLSLHFLMAGVARGEKGLYFGFYESREQLFNKASRFGLDLAGAVASGLIKIITLTPVELEPDKVAARIRELVEAEKSARVVLDGLREVELVCQLQERSRDFIAALLSYFKGQGITSLYTYEISKIVGTELDLSGTSFTPLAENLLLLKQIEFHSALYSIISVLKMRDSLYDRAIREFRITNEGGLMILEPFKSAEGLLSGLARSLNQS